MVAVISVEVERPYRARADFAGTLHAEHKKAAAILLQLKGVCLSTERFQLGKLSTIPHTRAAPGKVRFHRGYSS